MNEEKPNYYAVIPAEIRYDEDLTPNEKILYGEITALTNKNGECWAGNKYFSKLYKVQLQSVSRWLKHLKQKGYININLVYKSESKEIEKRVIKINGIPVSENVKTFTQSSGEPINNNVNTYSQNCEGGINKNVKENNTSINNIKKRKYIKEKKILEDFIKDKNFSKELESTLEDWITYKDERNENYTEIGFKKLLSEIKNNTYIYSENQLIDLINKCMLNNWKGIQFQLLEKETKRREVKYL